VRTVTSLLLLLLALVSPAFADDDPAKAKAEREARFVAMKAEAEPYLTFGNQVIDMLADGDAKHVKARMSPSAVRRNGEAKLDEFVDTKLIPYFAKFDKVDDEFTVVARTNDDKGNKGFVIQYVFLEKDKTRRPLVMYVLREDEQYVIANIVPGRSIEEASRVRPAPQ
jgi:hypothetical protein